MVPQPTLSNLMSLVVTRYVQYNDMMMIIIIFTLLGNTFQVNEHPRKRGFFFKEERPKGGLSHKPKFRNHWNRPRMVLVSHFFKWSSIASDC